MRDVTNQFKQSRGRRLNVTDFSDEGPDARCHVVDVGAEARDEQEATGAWDVESLSLLRAVHEVEPEGLISMADADALIGGLE